MGDGLTPQQIFLLVPSNNNQINTLLRKSENETERDGKTENSDIERQRVGDKGRIRGTKNKHTETGEQRNIKKKDRQTKKRENTLRKKKQKNRQVDMQGGVLKRQRKSPK